MSDNYLKKELYERMREDQVIFDFLQDAALDGIWYWDLVHPENEWMSPKFWETFGYTPEEKTHSPSEWQSLVLPGDLKIAKANIRRHLDDPDHPYDQIIRYRHKNGSVIFIRCRGLAIRNDEGSPVRMLGAHMNVTDLMNSHNRIRRLKNEYEKVFNGTQDALFLIEVKGRDDFRYIRNNRSHQDKTGISQLMIEDKTPYDIVGREAGETVTNHYQKCVDKKEVISYEETLDLPSGKRIWHTTLTPIVTEGKVSHIVGSAVDITERKMLERELERRANFDSLTTLANRDNLTTTIERKTMDTDEPFTFIFMDLDKFKAINDNYGHLAGDQVLKTTAERLLTLTNEKDLVSRLGGDEFVILKFDIYDPDEIDTFLKTISETISRPIDYGGNELNVIASIGYSRFPLDGVDYDQLSYHADKAMYTMKAQRNGRKSK